MENLQSASNPGEATYPIRTVSKLTGVNAVTLRAWERRYGLLRPLRTPKGHRLYSQQDIDLIHWVIRQLAQGISVSQVKQRMLGGIEVGTKNAGEPDKQVWVDYQTRMITALNKFDENKLDAVYQEALSLYPIGIITRRLILPLLKMIGMRWESHVGLVTEEHFFCMYLRNKIGARFHHRGYHDAQAPRLICACLPGELHEMGLLLFSLAVMDLGYQIILLGANTPLDELPVVAHRIHARAIVLSGTSSVAEDTITNELAFLTRRLDIPVFVGGRISSLMREQIQSSGAIAVDEELLTSIDIIHDQLNSRYSRKGQT